MELSDKAIRDSYSIISYGKGLVEVVFHKEFFSTESIRQTKFLTDDLRMVIDNSPNEYINCLIDVRMLKKFKILPKEFEMYSAIINENRLHKVAVLGNSLVMRITIDFFFLGHKKIKYFENKSEAEIWLKE